jgi:hypothetical protein
MIGGMGVPEKILEASDDGQNFREVAKLSGDDDSPEFTISFAPVTAKYFRVSFKRTPPPAPPAWAQDVDPSSFGIKLPPKPTDYDIAELVLHSGPRVNRFEAKAAFVPVPDLYHLATPAVDAREVVAKSDVIDLTSKMNADGKLEWSPPEGYWVVLRFGYSLLGISNHPATAEATGLEVDKMDHRYVKNYMEKYLDSYKETVGADEMGKKGIRYVISDSWEAGSQNWTDNMIDEFKKLRGYDPVPWMPVLAGAIVDSADSAKPSLISLPTSTTDNSKIPCMSGT